MTDKEIMDMIENKTINNISAIYLKEIEAIATLDDQLIDNAIKTYLSSPFMYLFVISASYTHCFYNYSIRDMAFYIMNQDIKHYRSK